MAGVGHQIGVPPRAGSGAAGRARARGGWGRFRAYLRRRVLVAMGGVGLGVVVLAALAAPLLTPYDPIRIDLGNALQAPSLDHPLGTDDLGRDVFARVVYGARVSLAAGLITVIFAISAGVTLGLVGGFNAGAVDETLMRLMDAILAFPSLVLAMAITAALGQGLMNAMIAIGIVYTPHFARLTRGQVLSVKEMEFVEAARGLGAPTRRILWLHVLPNITAPIVAQAVISMASAIITEASLSFLGLGVQAPTPSWGAMLRAGYGYIEMAPWLSVAPGLAIFVTVLAFNFFGDGVQDALNPRRR
jgi:peptide/nickel transport system permease protein